MNTTPTNEMSEQAFYVQGLWISKGSKQIFNLEGQFIEIPYKFSNLGGGVFW